MEVRRLPGWSETNRTDELYHHGIKGQRWGIRRYQNENGTLTTAGKKKYRRGDKLDITKEDSSITRGVKNDYNKMSDKEFASKYKTTKNTYRRRVNKYGDPYKNSPLVKWAKKQNAKKRNGMTAEKEMKILDAERKAKAAKKAAKKMRKKKINDNSVSQLANSGNKILKNRKRDITVKLSDGDAFAVTNPSDKFVEKLRKNKNVVTIE